MSYFPMPEGRVLNNGGMLTQEFVIADQQGNARLSFQDNGNGIPVVKQENSYYAFGLIMPNSPVATPTTPNKKLYNGGSEWQNDFGNLPDYYQTFNRNYDAATGRFVGVDPMAESAESTTTYNYAGNNPVMFNDPMGDITAEQWANAIEYAYSTGNENRYYQDNGSNSSNVIATSGAFYGQDSPGPGPQASNGGGGAGGSAPLYSVLSNNDAFTMVTAYIDKFNAWGINGTPSSYEIAAGEYNHQLPAGSAKVNSRSYAGWIVLGNYYKTDANGNSETINGVSGSFESRQVTQAANQGESIWSQIWNSPVARYLVPDEIGINITVNDVIGFGFSGSIKGVFLTRGKDAGTGNVLLSGSARLGFDIGGTATVEDGWFLGDPRNATMDGLLGTGQDASLGIGPYAGGVWRSLDSQGNPTWAGIEAGVGIKSPFAVGGSVGQSQTVTVPQFVQFLSNTFHP